MRLPPIPFVGSARYWVGLAFVCLSFAAAGDAVALDTTDTKHTGVGALISLRRSGELNVACSGTLVAPDVFLTAGHCTSLLKYLRDIGAILDIFVSFDTEITPTASLVSVVDLVTHPEFPPDAFSRRDFTHDIGVVLLATPVSDRPLASLPTEGLLDQLRPAPGMPLTAVGYGRDSNDVHGAASPHFNLVKTGLRSSGNVSYRGLTRAFIPVTQLANQGDDNVCFGDSGGPDFLSVDGEEQLVALNSLVSSYACEEVGWLYRLDTTEAREFLSSYVDLP